MLVFVFPAAPTLAGMTSTDLNDSANIHCSDKIQTLSSVSNTQLFAVDIAMKEHKDCKKSCCPASNCVCQGPCQHFSASSNANFLKNLNNVPSLRGDRNSQYPALNIHPLNTYYLPALRPPIC
jgi:hypothetical protein